MTLVFSAPRERGSTLREGGRLDQSICQRATAHTWPSSSTLGGRERTSIRRTSTGFATGPTHAPCSAELQKPEWSREITEGSLGMADKMTSPGVNDYGADNHGGMAEGSRAFLRRSSTSSATAGFRPVTIKSMASALVKKRAICVLSTTRRGTAPALRDTKTFAQPVHASDRRRGATRARSSCGREQLHLLTGVSE